MFNPALRTAKLKTACKLCSSRIKLLKNKRTIQVDQMCKEIAGLLESDKKDYAWIRVEAILREKNLLYAYEILELYLELIAVRAQLLDKSKECPRDMVEAVTSLFYASTRVPDLPELLDVRKILNYKYGKELGQEGISTKNKINYSDTVPENWQVNHNLRRFLAVEAPEPEEKLTQLSEIAEKFNVPFDIEEYSQCSMVQNDPKYEMASVHIKHHVYTSGHEDGYPPVPYVSPPQASPGPGGSSSNMPSYRPMYDLPIGSSAVPEPDSFPSVQPIEKSNSGMNPYLSPGSNVPKSQPNNVTFNNSNLSQDCNNQNINTNHNKSSHHSPSPPVSGVVIKPPESFTSPPPFLPIHPNSSSIEKKDSDVSSIQEKYDAAQGPPDKKTNVIDTGNELPSAPTVCDFPPAPPLPPTHSSNVVSPVVTVDKDDDLSELNRRLLELRKRS